MPKKRGYHHGNLREALIELSELGWLQNAHIGRGAREALPASLSFHPEAVRAGRKILLD